MCSASHTQQHPLLMQPWKRWSMSGPEKHRPCPLGASTIRRTPLHRSSSMVWWWNMKAAVQCTRAINTISESIPIAGRTVVHHGHLGNGDVYNALAPDFCSNFDILGIQKTFHYFPFLLGGVYLSFFSLLVGKASWRTGFPHWLRLSPHLHAPLFEWYSIAWLRGWKMLWGISHCPSVSRYISSLYPAVSLSLGFSLGM